MKTLEEMKDLDEVREVFRGYVLKALDRAAREVLHVPGEFALKAGASDEDLPQLFEAIDNQVSRLCKRYGIATD